MQPYYEARFKVATNVLCMATKPQLRMTACYVALIIE